MVLWVGCGGADEKPVEAAEPPTSPSQPTPKAEAVAAPKPVITPGMKAAQQSLDAGTYALAARLYAAQVAAEEAKPTPSWVQLSYLYNQLGEALHHAAQYDKA